MSSRDYSLDPYIGLKWIWGKGLIQNDEVVVMNEENEILHLQHHTSWLNYDNYLNFNDHKYQSLKNLLSGEIKEEGSCLHWGGSHLKMFDGTLLTTPSFYDFILVQEIIDNLIKISTRNSNCIVDVCQMTILMEVESEEIEIEFNNDYPTATMNGESFNIPGHHNGILFEVIEDWLIVEVPGLGFSIYLSNEKILQIKLSSSLWNRTVGICGTLSGNYVDDFHDINGAQIGGYNHLLDSWKTENKNNRLMKQTVLHPCREKRMEEMSSNFCQKMLNSVALQECYKSVNPLPYFEACKWSYCENTDQLIESHCQSVASYVNTCRAKGITVSNWRQPDFCGKENILN